MVYEPRSYRGSVDATGLVSFTVSLAETDLQVSASRDLSGETLGAMRQVREPLERYIALHPRFAESYAPLEVEPGVPEIVAAMAAAGRVAGVGPMASVAGAVAERVARQLAAHSPEVIVENGGDLFLMGARDRTIALWAADSPFTGTLGLTVRATDLPLAVCTSSGRIGHSASFGRSDTVTVLAKDGALADAAATSVANRVRAEGDIEAAIAFGRAMDGVSGILIAVGERIGAWGGVELVPLGE